MKILNLMNKKKLTAQGSITVFMTFIFMIILSLILAIFENTRIISSTGYMKNASLSAEKTLFGDYNLELYKEYGLFGIFKSLTFFSLYSYIFYFIYVRICQ